MVGKGLNLKQMDGLEDMQCVAVSYLSNTFCYLVVQMLHFRITVIYMMPKLIHLCSFLECNIVLNMKHSQVSLLFLRIVCIQLMIKETCISFILEQTIGPY